jgi:hypothetical protein
MDPIAMSLSIPSVKSVQLQKRRVDRRRAGAARVRTAMMGGASLHLHYERGHPLWRLSTGLFVADDVAQAAIAQPDIVGAGDALFNGFPAQTWRYTKT